MCGIVSKLFFSFSFFAFSFFLFLHRGVKMWFSGTF